MDLLEVSSVTKETCNVVSFDMLQRPSGAANTKRIRRENRKYENLHYFSLLSICGIREFKIFPKFKIHFSNLHQLTYWSTWERNASDKMPFPSKIQTQLGVVKVSRSVSTVELLEMRQWTHQNLWILYTAWIFQYLLASNYISEKRYRNSVNRRKVDEVIKLQFILRQNFIMFRVEFFFNFLKSWANKFFHRTSDFLTKKTSSSNLVLSSPVTSFGHFPTELNYSISNYSKLQTIASLQASQSHDYKSSMKL